eukprot:CAMPEP_0176242080 /NCGR_PEP_ID=MMETSP0121_2-20121125/30224_1 /TAXON_ID=160619 /ORGANISM="Kryptoperidinium foliaceum, Strain CCMP 1326" /LENGTH=145 /DNA_ID=CAMNT_0017581631 /DNA_START=103 /DNA_END=536 /DNA_ORIENTATION=+
MVDGGGREASAAEAPRQLQRREGQPLDAAESRAAPVIEIRARLDEYMDDLDAGSVQGCVVQASNAQRGDVQVRPGADEVPQHGGPPEDDRGGHIGDVVDVAPGLQQTLGRPAAAGGGGEEQRCAACAVQSVDARTVAEQQADGIG